MLVLQAPSLEQGGEKAAAGGPGPSLTEEVRHLRRHAAERPREADRWEEVRDGDADIGVRRHELLLGLAQVGPALQKLGGESGRDVRREDLVVEARPARDGAGVPPQQEAEQVLLRLDLPFEVGDGGAGGGERRRGAGGLERGGGAGFEAPAEQGVGFLERGRRPPGDLELQVELAQAEVGGRDVRDEGEQDPAAGLLGGQVAGERRLVQAADAAPQVDLPGEAEVDVVEVHRGRDGRREAGLPAACPASVGLDLREELGAGDAGIRPRLLDAPGGEAHVVAVPQRLVDQGLQVVLLEDLPPGPVGERPRFGRGRLGRSRPGLERRGRSLQPAYLLGGRYGWAFVVGSGGAAGEQSADDQGGHDGESCGSLHARVLSHSSPSVPASATVSRPGTKAAPPPAIAGTASAIAGTGRACPARKKAARSRTLSWKRSRYR